MGTLNPQLLSSYQNHLDVGFDLRIGASLRAANRAAGVGLTRRWRELDSNHRSRLFEVAFQRQRRERFVADSSLEGTGFEPSVPLFRKGLSAVAQGDAGPIRWMGPLSTGRLARRRWSAAGPLSTAVSFSAGPMVRIRFPPAESLRTIGSAGRELPASDAARCGGITALFRRGSARGIWQYPQIPVTAGFLSIRRVTLSPLPHLRERGAYRAGGNLKHLSDERYSKHDGGVPETRALRRPPG